MSINLLPPLFPQQGIPSRNSMPSLQVLNEDNSFLPSPYTQKGRALSLAMLDEYIPSLTTVRSKMKEEDREDKQQDNIVREAKVSWLIHEFDTLVHTINQKYYVVESEEVHKLRRKAMLKADKICTLYNLKLDPIEFASLDSKVILYPIEDLYSYLMMLQMLFKLLIKFPYTFLMAIGLKTIRVCQYYEMTSERNQEYLQNKIKNGLLILSEITNEKKLADSLYKIIIHLMVKAEPQILSAWKLNFNNEGTLNIAFAKPELDMKETLRLLMQIKEGTKKMSEFGSEIQEKIRMLKSKFEELDPAGISGNWISREKLEVQFTPQTSPKKRLTVRTSKHFILSGENDVSSLIFSNQTSPFRRPPKTLKYDKW